MAWKHTFPFCVEREKHWQEKAVAFARKFVSEDLPDDIYSPDRSLSTQLQELYNPNGIVMIACKFEKGRRVRNKCCPILDGGRSWCKQMMTHTGHHGFIVPIECHKPLCYIGHRFHHSENNSSFPIGIVVYLIKPDCEERTMPEGKKRMTTPHGEPPAKKQRGKKRMTTPHGEPPAKKQRGTKRMTAPHGEPPAKKPRREQALAPPGHCFAPPQNASAPFYNPVGPPSLPSLPSLDENDSAFATSASYRPENGVSHTCPFEEDISW